VHADGQGRCHRRGDELPGGGAAEDSAEDDADGGDRQHDPEQQLEQSPPVEVELRPDQMEPAVGIAGREPVGIAEPGQDGPLGGLVIFAVRHPRLDRVGDRGVQLGAQVAAVALRYGTRRGADVTLGVVGHVSAPGSEIRGRW
jgi:hypothetical protein